MENEKQIKKPELLCPAGSSAALAAAIEGGADAIYLGGVAFNARIHAKNFTHDELRDGISLAHAYGAKVYVTANTLIYDKELDEFLRAAEDAYLCGADALIVADLGAAAQVRSRIPIDLHASTQVSGHNVEAAKRLAELGFSRMVCAREMSREDLSYFVKHSPIEAEVFVHGALCVCHSGQCLFSSLVGGRSGNRGECAQPCRLPFATKKGVRYPLSLKDLSLARHIPELCEMGIASFKIEGRMKSPEYVRDVARIWRRLIDENRGADDRDMAELAAVFSRGGLTDGYYTRSIGRSMLGVRSEQDKQISRSLESFDKITRKIPIELKAEIRAGLPSSLSVLTWGDDKVTVTGEIPQTARTAPLDGESVKRCLTKLGNTPYVAESIQVELDEGLMLPISSLNALRRSAIDELMQRHEPKRNTDDFSPLKRNRPNDSRGRERTAVFYDPRCIPVEAHEFFDLLFVPLDRYDGSTRGVLLPAVIYDSERKAVESMLKIAVEQGATYALVSNLGQISLASEFGLTVYGDFRLNTTNQEAAALWETQKIERLILSPELTLPQMRDVGGATSAIVYGRVPLMVTEKCVGKEISDCKQCEQGNVMLTDRRRVSFPVLREWEHRSLIVNSVPIWMADRADVLARHKLSAHHFIFTVESKREIAEVIRAYQKQLPPKGEVRRIR